MIAGLWMRWAIIPLIATMGVAVYLVHLSAFDIAQNGMEYALTLGVVLVGLALTGAGRFHVMAVVPRRTPMLVSTTSLEA